jgi:hypothetical protein
MNKKKISKASLETSPERQSRSLAERAERANARAHTQRLRERDACDEVAALGAGNG